MKKILNIILGIFIATVATAQTQPNLPTGTQPYSGNIFISPDGTLWTGKAGSYTAIAKKTDIPEINVLPSDLGLTDVEAGRSYLPVMRNGNWLSGGYIVSPNPGQGFVAQYHTAGRLRVGNGSAGDDAVNKHQLDSVGNISGEGFDPQNSGNTSVTGAEQSRILNSFNSTIDGGIYNNPRNFILNSENSGIYPIGRNHLILASRNSRVETTVGGSDISGGVVIGSYNSRVTGYISSGSILSSESSRSNWSQRTSIIASQNATIGARRQQSAIIASTAAQLEDWASTTTLKWNSAIIASHGGVVQSSNSYALVTGKKTQSNGSAQFVCGQSNIIEPSRSVEDPLKKAFIVGNGTGDVGEVGVRSNAFYVQQNGNAWVQNEFEVDKAGGGVVLKSPNGTRFRLTVDNSGNLQTEQLN